jgi:hypothetical protein
VGPLGLDGDVEEEHGGREEREERGQRERVAQRRERAHGGPEEEERLQREQPEQRGGVRGGREAAPAAAGGLGRGREGRGRESEGRVRGQPRRRGQPEVRRVAAGHRRRRRRIRDGGGGRRWTRGCEAWTVVGDWLVVHLDVMGRASGSIWASLKLTQPSKWPGGILDDTLHRRQWKEKATIIVPYREFC